MSTANAAGRWDETFAKGDAALGWYPPEPRMSLRMLERAGSTCADSLIDVGGGASRLVDALLELGYRDLTVLDLSARGLRIARDRLAANAARVDWLVADLLSWQPERTYQVWHDRAVFHFLTTDEARRRYLRTLTAATRADSVAVIGTFAPDGPQLCSGLPVVRYSAAGLAATLGSSWLLAVEDREEHTTPWGVVQPYTWTAFRRQS